MEHLEKRCLLPVRKARADPADPPALGRLPAPRLPPEPARRERGTALADRAPRPVLDRWRPGVVTPDPDEYFLSKAWSKGPPGFEAKCWHAAPLHRQRIPIFYFRPHHPGDRSVGRTALRRT